MRHAPGPHQRTAVLSLPRRLYPTANDAREALLRKGRNPADILRIRQCGLNWACTVALPKKP